MKVSIGMGILGALGAKGKIESAFCPGFERSGLGNVSEEEEVLSIRPEFREIDSFDGDGAPAND
jgi:hypothetical protein